MAEQHERRRGWDELVEKIDMLCNKINSIDEIIHGNEQPGLRERVNNMETFILDLKRFHSRIQGIIIGSAATIVTSVIIAAIIQR